MDSRELRRRVESLKNCERKAMMCGGRKMGLDYKV
jgi:hypothetical protein